MKAFKEWFNFYRAVGSGSKPAKQRSKSMAVAKKKPFLGWAFESPKGKFYEDVWSYKPATYDYPDGDWNLVRVQISKYVSKKK